MAVSEGGRKEGAPAGATRKREHLRINLEEDVGAKGVTTGFERYRLVHQALPELDLAAVDTFLPLFGQRLRAPLIISSMTGGTEEGARINRVLAAVAQALGIGMGVGSQRVAVEDGPAVVRSFQVRPLAPDVLLFANLGAVQLNYGFGPEECRRVVEMIEADALVLHLNPLQEAVQPGGTTNFAGLARRIAAVCRALSVPVVVKEVGWGIPTAESLRLCRAAVPGLSLIASGGIRDGINVAKAIALGATAAGIAGPALRAAAVSAAALADLLEELIEELRIAMFCTGARDLAALARVPLRRLED